jgi:uncharacterized protein (DUF1697 family)
MPTASAIRIALLRAVNVAGHNRIGMSQLRDLLTELGFAGVRSLLQTGNLIFQSDAETDADIEHLLETQARKRLNLRADFVVRTAQEIRTVVAHNPFREEAERDPGHLVVMFLKSAAKAKDMEGLRLASTGPEIIRTKGRELYLVYPNGIGRSRLTNALIERKLGTRARRAIGTPY